MDIVEGGEGGCGGVESMLSGVFVFFYGGGTIVEMMLSLVGAGVCMFYSVCRNR